MSLLGRLKYLQYKQETPDKYSQVQPAAEAEHEGVPIWLHPQMNSSNIVAMPGSQNAAAPDLELTLAAPKAMISVT